MTGALLAWAALAASLAVHPPEDNAPRLDDIHAHMSYPGVEVKVGWYRCGAENAYYYYQEKEVRMCVELIEAGVPNGVIRWIFAHEMAHAIIRQLDIPYVYSEEAAADELAGYVLYLSGNKQDISDAADYFATKHMNGYIVHPLADHPDHLKRALTIKCHSLGRDGVLLGCPRSWPRLVWTWNRLLHVED